MRLQLRTKMAAPKKQSFAQQRIYSLYIHQRSAVAFFLSFLKVVTIYTYYNIRKYMRPLFTVIIIVTADAGCCYDVLTATASVASL